MTADPFWDEPFFGCVVSAFIEQARAEQGWPDMRKTQQRAYKMFEDGKKTQAR